MTDFSLTASDGAIVQVYGWLPSEPRAIVQIAHGMGEHAGRYQWVAQQLNEAGYAVYANDHRGHGITGQDLHGYSYGYMGGDGWNRTLADAYELNRHVHRQHGSELPLILLGHSMGAMLAQQYVTRYPASIQGLVLSGSPGFQGGLLPWIPRAIAGFESWRLGPDAMSPLLQRLLFGDSNKAFDAPEASGFEWLSRDAEQVQAYVDDPACGFVLTAGSLVDLFRGAARAKAAASLANIPTTLPVYVFSGSDDPVHNEQRNLQALVGAYRQRGVSVEYRLYPGGRHEMFNETNREQVVKDLLAQLEQMIQD